MPNDAFNISERKWVADFGLAISAAKTAEVSIEKRKTGQDLAASLIAGKGDTIREGLTFEIEMIPDGVVGKFKAAFGKVDTMKSIDKNKGPLGEIDTWHDVPGSKALSKEELDGIGEAYDQIIDVQNEMKELTDGDGYPIYKALSKDEIEAKFVADKKKLEEDLAGDEEALKEALDDLEARKIDKLFGYDEEAEKLEAERRLSEDLWEPMKREGIVPENMIPTAYSEAARIGAGAMEAYKKRLEEYTSNQTKMGQLLADLGPGFQIGQDLLGATASAAGGLVGIDGIGDTPKQVAQFATMLKITTASVQTGAEKIVKHQDILGAAEAAIPALTSIVSAAAGKEMGAMVTAIVSTSVKGAKVGEKLAKKDYAGAAEALGSAIGSGMGASGDPGLTAIGGYLSKGVSGIGSSKRVMDAVRKEPFDPKNVIGAFQVELTAQFNSVEKIVAAEIEKGIGEAIDKNVSDPGERKKLHELLNKKGAKMAGDEAVIASMGDMGRIIDSIVNDPIRKAATEQIKKNAEEERKRLEEMAEQDPEGFAELLPVDEESYERAQKLKQGSVNNIDKLMAMVRRDQMIFDMAKKIATGTTGMIAAFVPAAGIAPVATQLMFSITEAVQRARHVDKWRRNLRDAKNAQSILADAAYSEFYQQVSQQVELDIKVGLLAVQLLAKAVETAALASGMGAPAAAAGAAVAGAAAAGQGLLSVAVTVKTTAEMAQAWSLYKKAKPEDRKSVREAIRANPTLAKYAMAYGAVTDKNKVAVICLKRCGLNEKTLANPTTNVSKVVEYLETVYRDDPTILRAIATPKKWHPGEVELTAISYSKFCMTAFTKADPPVRRDEDNTVINAKLMVIDALPDGLINVFGENYMIKDTDKKEDVEKAQDAAGAVVEAIKKYHPKDPDGADHKEMLDYLEALSAKAELAEKAAKSVVEAIGAD
ncbi:hypothetical protein [Sedimentitalea todarodis]|uniref:Uncharacterized protein n=1 Tax=Sedimentitalea todarodis TaxID=1631240 RepID=A0ABU3VHJ9_9RHOB|nr:hypothetical protein [Sedimentitalea todarodis]MDU9005563.1 hypothetical protein [Sedimentitalea todarodis]